MTPRFTTLLALLVLAGCAPEKPLKIYGDVPDFELTDQTGRKFDSKVLFGHVWVVDFIYTSCQGPCPRMSSHMHAVQAATGPSVRMVSFTVDPDTDTPPVLATYAKKFAADETRWSFLTGSKDTLNLLGRDAFHLGSVGNGIDHSTRFVLVDRKGRIRGYYGIADGNPVSKIAKDAARLETEVM
jgi:protein SCO1/2